MPAVRKQAATRAFVRSRYRSCMAFFFLYLPIAAAILRAPASRRQANQPDVISRGNAFEVEKQNGVIDASQTSDPVAIRISQDRIGILRLAGSQPTLRCPPNFFSGE
jgi:hypothetical protein